MAKMTKRRNRDGRPDSPRGSVQISPSGDPEFLLRESPEVQEVHTLRIPLVFQTQPDSNELAQHAQRIKRKILSCRASVEAIDDAVINVASQLHQRMLDLGLLKTGAFPGPNGELMVTLYHQDHYLEFIVEYDETITFCHQQDDEELCYEEVLSFQEAIHKTWEFYEECKRSDISRLAGGIASRIRHDSSLTVSKLMIGADENLEYQLSTTNVYSNQGAVFVGILTNTTEQTRQSPSSSGRFLHMNCLESLA